MRTGVAWFLLAVLAGTLCACSDPAPVCRATGELTRPFLVPRDSFQGPWTHRAELVWTEGDVGVPEGTRGPRTATRWLEPEGILIAVRETDPDDYIVAFDIEVILESGEWSDTGAPCFVTGDEDLAVRGDELRVDWSKEEVANEAVLPFGPGLRAEATGFHTAPTELPEEVWKPRFETEESTGRVRSFSVATMYLLRPRDCTTPCDDLTLAMVRHRLSAE